VSCYSLCRFLEDVSITFSGFISLIQSQAHLGITTIALGSDRAAKIMAVRAGIARVATIDPAWADVKLVARKVETNAPAMPLTDWELMQGARERALAVYELLKKQRLEADLYVGLEGGFHSISIEGEWHTFLRGWAYVTDGTTDQETGRMRGSFGATPSISVPDSIKKSVIEGRQELGLVIDEVAGARDVRSRQGAWGILSRDLVTRSMSFELALIAAFAPFYNAALYT
jgi:non-canonical (house-cleaning) NTP pyrophosphatase